MVKIDAEGFKFVKVYFVLYMYVTKCTGVVLELTERNEGFETLHGVYYSSEVTSPLLIEPSWYMDLNSEINFPITSGA